MKIVKVLLWLVVLAVLGYLVYILVGYLGREDAEQVDLGVEYSQSDAASAIDKSGVEVRDLSALSLGSDFSTEGTVDISDNFSDAEISAIQNGANSSSGPFKDVQIHFIGNDKVEGSGFVSHPQVNAPVYAKGSVVKTGPKSFSVDLDSVKVGNTKVPFFLYGTIQSRFSNYVNGILADIDGLDVKNVEIRDGGVFFEGTVPQNIS